ncbi:MAG: 3-phosphoshikimate 1-carboxyvinyltransferase [Chloroflexi bacterium]|nr:MAG: 3-phosphoshikimate 1-carboxyvinyltransferase [Chloroflexota bacterium]
MATRQISAAPRLRGALSVPGDKSISHRAVMFNAIAEGKAEITHFLPGADCLSTIACFRAMGVQIEQHADRVVVHGVGLRGLREPSDVLDCGNSGTTLRLMTGLLAGIDGMYAVLTGDASLRSRPQRRIVDPLRGLGATLDGRQQGTLAPITVRGARMHGGHYELPIASAQVKSAVLLAALSGDGIMTVSGRIDGRDHTERMLAGMGIDIQTRENVVTLTPPVHPVFPYALSLRVPGDPSSAAFWWVAAAIHPNAELTTMGVGMNPTRIGALEVLRAMGARVTVSNMRTEGSEPVADVTVASSSLTGTTIHGSIIPALIDEIPVLAVAAAMATGQTVIADAAELKAKETDRIQTVVEALQAMGVRAEATADGMIIEGRGHLDATQVDSHGDHRLAMAWAVAALVARGEMHIAGSEAVDVSYPDFWRDIAAIAEQG